MGRGAAVRKADAAVATLAPKCPCGTHLCLPPVDIGSMACPACGERLIPYFSDETRFGRCRACALVVWHDGARLVQVVGAALDNLSRIV